MSTPPPNPSIAPDDPTRQLTVADPDDPALTHLGVVGDTYTVLVSGEQTAGRYALIDMLIPAGGGPPPHRHAFEEQFHVLEGEITLSFRDSSAIATAGMTVNIPALAPHRFVNSGDVTARLLCMVSPAGLEEYFAAFGDPVESRTAAAPQHTPEEIQQRLKETAPIAAKLGIEALAPE